MNICVFCSAQAVPEKYQEPAAEFGKLLARSGHTLVWGGSDRGIMKVIADAVHAGGGRLVGISMELVKHKLRTNVDEAIIASDLGERKKLMLARSDALVVLAGGLGTLDEASEVLALKRHGTHHQPIVFLNTDGFYNGLKTQLARMDNEGFLGNLDHDVVEGLDNLAYFADTPEDAMRYIEGHGN